MKSLFYKFIWTFIRPNHYLFVLFNRIESFLLKAFFRKKFYIETFSKKTLLEYCRQNNIQSTTLEEAVLREVFVPKYYERNNLSRIFLIPSPKIYFIKIFNVEIVAESSFIIKDKLILHDMFDSTTEKRYDLRFGSILSLGKSGDVVIKFNNIEKVKINKGIFLIGFGSFNYFHFTVELMSKFNYINNNNKFLNYPIIVDEIVLEIPQFKELLFSLNYTKREVIKLKKQTKYSVSELIYISDVSCMPININGRSNMQINDFRISKNSLKYLNNKVLSKITYFKNIKPFKIFISRNPRFFQRLVNQTEISLLFKSYGFIIVNTDELSLREQVHIFSTADVVAGVTGAALTNIIYCKPGTTFVSIIPMKHNFSMYSTIAHHLGIHSMFLDAEIVKKGDKESNDLFKLDLKYCERFLIKYYSN